MTKSQGFGEKPSPFRDERGIGRAPERIPKRSVNVSVQQEILAEAKAMKLNLSQILEDELRKRVRSAFAAKWEEESREAIESYNRFIEKHGIWSKKYRKW